MNQFGQMQNFISILLIVIKICATKSDYENLLNLPVSPPIKINEKTYYIETFFKANWYRAGQFCRYHNMHLASINGQEENDEIGKRINETGLNSEHFWTSGNDLAQNNSYVWLTTGESIIFDNWQDREPNHLVVQGEEEHCIEVDGIKNPDFRFNDALCSKEFYFICEKTKI